MSSASGLAPPRREAIRGVICIRDGPQRPARQDMVQDIRFPNVIRTRSRAHSFPDRIETVEQAIDGVQELPPVMLKLDPWRPVSLALWEAVDFPDDAGRLAAADQLLCAALAAEDWLEL